MKRNFIILFIAALFLLLTGCTVKQGKLIVVEKHNNIYSKSEGDLSLNFNIMPQKISVENNAAILKKLDFDTIPIAINQDTGLVIGFSYIDSNETDEINSKVITGNMLQPVNLYAIDTKNNDKIFLGNFLSLRDFQFDDTGKLFAFIDGSSNIYVYDSEEKQLQKIIEGKNYYSYDSISWSKDSDKLLINQRMTLDISSKQLISFAVEAYNPFVEQKFNNQGIYIVQMKNSEYNDMIALYNYTNRSFKSLANGVFLDSDNVNMIYTKVSQSNLYMLNMETLESTSLESGPIYNAKIMKSTGDILYTTVNPDLTSGNRYILVKLNPNTGVKKAVELPSPTFYLSPSEIKLYFVGDYNRNKITVDTEGLTVSRTGNEKDDSDLSSIKSVILKMFRLDYSFAGTYEEYETQASKIYTNTISPSIQDALENKLIDFKRFNMPLPTWQKDPVVPANIKFNSYSIKEDSASVNIGFFFVNAIELVKQDENWLITGFSTHPDSKEVKEVRSIVQKHIHDIKTKNSEEALKYWQNENNSDFNEKQLQIVRDLMESADTSKIEVGEIELWSLSEPHRAESAQTAVEAKVKVVISDEGSAKKYKLVLSKVNRSSFIIDSWSIDPLSVSQLR